MLMKMKPIFITFYAIITARKHDCSSDERTVGTCAHIVSIMWYLGYTRHEGFTAPAAFLNDIIIDNNV